MPKGSNGLRPIRGQKSAFSGLTKPRTVFTEDVRAFETLAKGRQPQKYRMVQRDKNLKNLRSRLCDIMELNVIYQPASAGYECMRTHRGKTTKRRKIVDNPVWGIAPKGAFYKSKKICSLLNLLACCSTKISLVEKDLYRLSTYVWVMSKRHFDGLLRTIRAKLALKLNKKPEAMQWTKPLSINPFLRESEKYFTSKYTCRHKTGFFYCRSSKKLECARLAPLCIKCKLATCVARWFTPYRLTAL